MSRVRSSSPRQRSALAYARRVLSCVITCVSLDACASSGHDPNVLPTPDYATFESQVYPLLLRDCAFVVACHGSEHRFFQVYGPGRTRLDPRTPYTDPATSDEVKRSYERARSMLTNTDRPIDSLLLTKPLEAANGGTSHKGVDDYGRNLFASRQDSDYLTILQWAQASGMQPPANLDAGATP